MSESENMAEDLASKGAPMATPNDSSALVEYSSGDRPNANHTKVGSVPKARDTNPVYTQRTENVDREENNMNPSPMYAVNASPRQEPSIIYTHEHACSSGHLPNARGVSKSQDSNPVYTQSTVNADRTHQGKTRNPCPMYTRNAVNPNTTCPTVEHVEEDSSGSHYYVNNDDTLDYVEEDNSTGEHYYVDDEDKPVESVENGQTVHTACDDVDMEPYAVAHMCADQEASATSPEATQTNERSHDTNTATNIRRNVSSNLAGTTDETNPSDTVADNSTLHNLGLPPNAHHPNPVCGQNALNPNLMYVPNVCRQAGHRCRRVCVAVAAAILLVLITGGVGKAFFGMDSKDTQNLTPSVDTIQTTGKLVSYSLGRTRPTKADPLNMSSLTPSVATTLTTGQPACCSTETTRMADSSYMSTTRTTVSPASRSSPESLDADAKSKKIAFGGQGSGPGKFHFNTGVAVSANNEIFVTDLHNKRVQIFTIDGAFLSNFSTIVPGEKGTTMCPYDIAIDRKANLWVVGNVVDLGPLRIRPYLVKYSQDSLPITKFDIPATSIQGPRRPTITVDTRWDKIIVVHKDTVFTYVPDKGYFHQNFTKRLPLGYLVSYITLDLAGNILLTHDHPWDYGSVHVYSRNGQMLFEFSTKGGPRGICVDPTTGNILVANRNKDRVDMFTSSGEFVRTVVKASRPDGIALGPDGHLVVNTAKVPGIGDHTVIVFPRHMVFGY
ncbi:uncharacterized protein LOC144915750 isoform X2 [Branchiostoma floridae x Branchiostoma belcheri]